MEYFYLIPSGVVFFSLLIFIYYFIKNQKKFKRWEKENRQLPQIMNRDIYPSLEGIEEKIKDIESEINELYSHLIKIHQDQISWLSSKKELPKASQMILLLDHHKKEHHGYLNPDKEGWTITSLGKEMKKVSLEKISHWKPIFHF